MNLLTLDLRGLRGELLKHHGHLGLHRSSRPAKSYIDFLKKEEKESTV